MFVHTLVTFIKKLNLSSFKSIFFIFIFAFVIRILFLSTAPFSFHVDEVISGYIGRFILLNGKDVYGNTFPLFYFDSFGDFRTILPMYINGLSTFLFGVNEFAVRFPTALAGALIVFPVYSLGNIFFKNKKIALLPALLITILPWHIVLSRASSEAAFGLTIFVFGITLFLKSLSIKKLKTAFK